MIQASYHHHHNNHLAYSQHQHQQQQQQHAANLAERRGLSPLTAVTGTGSGQSTTSSSFPRRATVPSGGQAQVQPPSNMSAVSRTTVSNATSNSNTSFPTSSSSSASSSAIAATANQSANVTASTFAISANGNSYPAGKGKRGSIVKTTASTATPTMGGPTPNSQTTGRPWTPEDDLRLRQAIDSIHRASQSNKHGGGGTPTPANPNTPLPNNAVKSWAKVTAVAFPDGRFTKEDCAARWKLLSKPQSIKGPWSAHEDRMLLQLVQQFGPEKWVVIAEHLGSRSGKQCRERWHNHVDPTINKSPYTPEEDALIMELVEKKGSKWAEIAKYLNGRPDNSIKNHYNTTLIRRRQFSKIVGGAARVKNANALQQQQQPKMPSKQPPAHLPNLQIPYPTDINQCLRGYSFGDDSGFIEDLPPHPHTAAAFDFAAHHPSLAGLAPMSLPMEFSASTATTASTATSSSGNSSALMTPIPAAPFTAPEPYLSFEQQQQQYLLQLQMQAAAAAAASSSQQSQSQQQQQQGGQMRPHPEMFTVGMYYGSLLASTPQGQNDGTRKGSNEGVETSPRTQPRNGQFQHTIGSVPSSACLTPALTTAPMSTPVSASLSSQQNPTVISPAVLHNTRASFSGVSSAPRVSSAGENLNVQASTAVGSLNPPRPATATATAGTASMMARSNSAAPVLEGISSNLFETHHGGSGSTTFLFASATGGLATSDPPPGQAIHYPLTTRGIHSASAAAAQDAGKGSEEDEEDVFTGDVPLHKAKRATSREPMVQSQAQLAPAAELKGAEQNKKETVTAARPSTAGPIQTSVQSTPRRDAQRLPSATVTASGSAAFKDGKPVHATPRPSLPDSKRTSPTSIRGYQASRGDRALPPLSILPIASSPHMSPEVVRRARSDSYGGRLRLLSSACSMTDVSHAAMANSALAMMGVDEQQKTALLPAFTHQFSPSGRSTFSSSAGQSSVEGSATRGVKRSNAFSSDGDDEGQGRNKRRASDGEQSETSKSQHEQQQQQSSCPTGSTVASSLLPSPRDAMMPLPSLSAADLDSWSASMASHDNHFMNEYVLDPSAGYDPTKHSNSSTSLGIFFGSPFSHSRGYSVSTLPRNTP